MNYIFLPHPNMLPCTLLRTEAPFLEKCSLEYILLPFEFVFDSFFLISVYNTESKNEVSESGTE